jgi:hypothetical protein
MMRKICAWCEKEMEQTLVPQDGITHGICPECARSIFSQQGTSHTLQVFLDSITVPVVAIDGLCRVTAVNESLRQLVGKADMTVVNSTPGEVVECRYAFLPEGCGETIHCSGCVIRRAIVETFKTGQVQDRVPALLQRNDKDIGLYITTERVGDVVLLRIDAD